MYFKDSTLQKKYIDDNDDIDIFINRYMDTTVIE